MFKKLLLLVFTCSLFCTSAFAGAGASGIIEIEARTELGDRSVDCVKHNIGCPFDLVERRQLYGRVLDKVFSVVGSLDATYEDRHEAKDLALSASRFLVRDSTTEIYNMAMDTARQIVGSIDSTDSEREYARRLAEHASVFLVNSILDR